MPVYDYTCAECGNFELVRRISDRNEHASCPRCGTQAQRVVIGAPSLGETGADEVGSYGMRHGGACACCR